MSTELIERFMHESGMTNYPLLPPVECQARFAALVAEQCAQIVDREFDDVLAQDAIRAAFPMPKD